MGCVVSHDDAVSNRPSPGTPVVRRVLGDDQSPIQVDEATDLNEALEQLEAEPDEDAAGAADDAEVSFLSQHVWSFFQA